MPTVRFDVTIERDNFARLAAQALAKAGQIVRKTAFDIEGQAKADAPVDTGALRNSIQAEAEEALTWAVAVGVEYGIYQELGTYKMPAHPYLIPAAESNRDPFLAAMGNLFGAAL